VQNLTRFLMASESSISGYPIWFFPIRFMATRRDFYWCRSTNLLLIR